MQDGDWRSMPPLTALRAFEATARLNGFSAAARSLSVTHAAVAQQVRALEDHLGVALVYREGRGMALTPEGARLAEGLGEGFTLLHQSVAALRAEKEERALNISMTPAFASLWLMPRLGGFWEKHPDIPVSLHPERKLVDLAREGMDMAIRFGKGPWPGLESKQLASAEFVIIGAPSLLKGKTSLTLEEMAKMPWILERHFSDAPVWLTSMGLCVEDLKITHLPNDIMALTGAIQGYGLYVMPFALVEADLKSGRLLELYRSEPGQASYHLVTRPGALDQRLKTFIRWLKSAA